MNKVLLFLGLAGCVYVARPIDIIGGHPYCQAVTDYRWDCRDDRGQRWRCVFAGRWYCERL